MPRQTAFVVPVSMIPMIAVSVAVIAVSVITVTVVVFFNYPRRPRSCVQDDVTSEKHNRVLQARNDVPRCCRQ